MHTSLPAITEGNSASENEIQTENGSENKQGLGRRAINCIKSASTNKNSSAKVCLGVGLLQRSATSSSSSSSSSSIATANTTTNNNNEPIHEPHLQSDSGNTPSANTKPDSTAPRNATTNPPGTMQYIIHLPASLSSSPSASLPPPYSATASLQTPYVTTSGTIASDFRTWGFPVAEFPAQHRDIHALLATQDAEGVDQRERRSLLIDVWSREWIRRYHRLLSRRSRGNLRDEGGLGAAVGLGANCFTEGARGVEGGRRRGRGVGWLSEIIGLWFGVVRCEGGYVMEADEMVDELPKYTKGEDPPAYEE